jgi:hypothetical protein
MSTVLPSSIVEGSISNRGPFSKRILIADLPNFKNGKYFDISTYVTNMTVNYDMSLASQLSFDVIDIDKEMSKNNYFILGRDIIYETQTLGQINSYSGEIRPVSQLFEIANVSSSQGPGGNISYSVKCYSKAVQQMKRDKNPKNIKGNGTAFVREAARTYGLKFYGQETSKKKTINKSKGSKESESLWVVMERLATDAKFVLFEVDGTLVFASEQFLLNKWGTNIKTDTKSATNPKTKKKKSKKVTKRFIPLQFPNDGPQYVGTPGYFKLTENPTITKSSNDPYAAEGSCRVERINGTQIRPGMTAYVGTVPNMSGYYLVESVSFEEMTSNEVSVTFRTLQRDEEKDKIKLLPVGATYGQTFIAGVTRLRNTVESAKSADATGRPLVGPTADNRILPPNQPTEESPYIYPIMPFANNSKRYGSFLNFKTPSTGDADAVIITGNLNLWDRPVLPVRNKANTKTLDLKTVFSVTKVEQFGTEYRAIILPTIYTSTSGQAIEKTEQEVIAAYNAAGGYAGSAKHVGVVRGETKAKAILNARDYATLISFQQSAILEKRFPGVNFNDIPNTPGGPDSVWT